MVAAQMVDNPRDNRAQSLGMDRRISKARGPTTPASCQRRVPDLSSDGSSAL